MRIRRLYSAVFWFWALMVFAFPSAARAEGALLYAIGGSAAVWNIGHRDMLWYAGGGVEVLKGPLGVGGEAGYVYFPEVPGSAF
jgi:hypothetical protein